MRFTPKTDEEIAAENLWQPGEYGFEVVDRVAFGTKEYTTLDTQAKSGADMIRLVVKVYNNEGGFQHLVDYLLESMPGKLRHACEAVGLLSKYETGMLTASDFIGKQGFLKIKIEKDKTGQYADKNAVADYIPLVDAVARATNTPPPGHPVNDPYDSTIPF